MAINCSLFIVAILLLLSLHHTEAQIGVCYGMLGNNLPCAQDVVNLYESNGIGLMRIYAPDQDTLQALQGTNIQLMLGVPNENISCIASDQSVADEWVQTNVIPFASIIKYIAVGNEIKPYYTEAPFVEPAMQNILYSLNFNELGTQIKVSTAVDTSLITDSYPPSNAHFVNLTYITPIINFLTTNDFPLLVNIEPYVAYVSDPYIKLDYALFSANGTVFNDSGRSYNNLFDATYDAMYTAIEKVVTQTSLLSSDNKKGHKKGHKKYKPVVSETGWPSAGGFQKHKMEKNIGGNQVEENGWKISKGDDDGASVKNAKTFYTKLIKHVKEGTPLTQGQEIEVYLFSMFDENNKTGNVSEKHYGLFTPDEKPKYGNLNFC